MRIIRNRRRWSQMLVPDVSSFGFLDAPAVESLSIALLTIGYYTAVGPGYRLSLHVPLPIHWTELR